MKLVVVAGTGTEVGKTWVACQLVRHLRARGLGVVARKLAQSYAPGDEPTDAEILAEATGEKATSVCPAHRWYPRAMAPPMAAEAIGLPPFHLKDLLAELSWPVDARVGILEQAGGLGSPQAADGDGVDLVSALRPDLVVLVSGAGLGTLSHVRLAARALGESPVVYLNHFDAADELHVANRRWLAKRQHLDVVTDAGELAHAVFVKVLGWAQSGA